MMTRYFVTKKGFTIPELLIIILVIGILSAVTFVAYNGLQQRALRAALQTDLKTAGNLMAQARLQNLAREYPTTFPTELRVSPNVILVLTNTGDASSYCINGEVVGLSESWRFDNANGLSQGVCSGAVLAGSELKGTGAVSYVEYIADKNFTNSGWLLVKQAGSSSLSTRAGSTSDPLPTRNVLVIQNNASTTSWAYIRGVLSNPTALTSGKTYTNTIWARVASGTNIGTSAPGVMDGNATNRVLNFGNNATLDGTWRQLVNTRPASINGLNSSIFYMVLTPSHMNQNAVIELQAPSLQ